MVERPASLHLHPKTTSKFRVFTLLVSIAVIAFGFYLAWLAFKTLELTPFKRAGIAIMAVIIAGIAIWFFLIAIRRRSFRREIEDLKKYRVEYDFGVRTGHQKKTLPLRYHKKH